MCYNVHGGQPVDLLHFTGNIFQMVHTEILLLHPCSLDSVVMHLRIRGLFCNSCSPFLIFIGK